MASIIVVSQITPPFPQIDQIVGPNMLLSGNKSETLGLHGYRMLNILRGPASFPVDILPSLPEEPM